MEERRSKPLEQILEELPVGWFHYRLLFICGLAFMADGMEVSLLSFMSTCAGVDWNLSSYEIALITSVVFIGQLVGSSVFGPLADSYGRHKAFLISSVIITLGGILSGLATNYISLLLFRALVGFGVGGAFVPYDLLAEFLPNSHRGTFLIYIELFWTLGSMFVAGVAWICLSSSGWKVLTLITAIPVGIASIGCVLLLPESPRWLILQGRNQEAKEILIKASQINGHSQFPLCSEDFEISTEGIKHEKHASILDFLQPDHRNVSIPLWIVWICFGFSYYGVILLIARLFEAPPPTASDGAVDSSSSSSTLVCDFHYSAIFMSALSEIFGVWFTALLIDPLGRVGTQASLYAGAAIGIFMMGLNLPHLALTVISVCSRICIMGSSSATWVATPELFTTELRGSGHAIANCMARIGALLVPFLVNSREVNVFTICCILSLTCLLATIASLYLPETTGKGIDEEKNLPRGQRMINQANKSLQSANDLISEESQDSEDSEYIARGNVSLLNTRKVNTKT